MILVIIFTRALRTNYKLRHSYSVGKDFLIKKKILKHIRSYVIRLKGYEKALSMQ